MRICIQEAAPRATIGNPNIRQTSTRQDGEDPPSAILLEVVDHADRLSVSIAALAAIANSFDCAARRIHRYSSCDVLDFAAIARSSAKAVIVQEGTLKPKLAGSSTIQDQHGETRQLAPSQSRV